MKNEKINVKNKETIFETKKRQVKFIYKKPGNIKNIQFYGSQHRG